MEFYNAVENIVNRVETLKDKQEERFDIEKIEDIYKYKAELIKTVQRLSE